MSVMYVSLQFEIGLFNLHLLCLVSTAVTEMTKATTGCTIKVVHVI